MSEIREAAAAVRDAFDTPYGLVSKRMATDGVDIFVEHGWGDLRRSLDGQVPIHDVVSDISATSPGSRATTSPPACRCGSTRTPSPS